MTNEKTLLTPAQHLKVLAKIGLELRFRNKNNRGSYDSLTPGECIGKLAPGEVVELMAFTPLDTPRPAFFASMKRDPQGEDSLVLYAPADMNERANKVIWNHSFRMAASAERGVGICKWPHNRLYFLIEGETPGQYFLYLVGVFAQEGESYIWVKPACQAKITRTSKGEVSIGNFAKSKLWQRFILEILGKPGCPRFDELEVDDSQAPLKEFDASGLQPGTGLVKFFNVFEGTGYVLFKDESGDVVEAKVHYSSLPYAGRGKPRLLEEGQIVKGTLVLGTHQQGPKKGHDYYEVKNVKNVVV